LGRAPSLQDGLSIVLRLSAIALLIWATVAIVLHGQYRREVMVAMSRGAGVAGVQRGWQARARMTPNLRSATHLVAF
jgi:hypothetical protein